MKNVAAVAAVAALAMLTGGCGGSDKPKAAATAPRTVDVEMHDISYRPTEVAVKAGETVRLVFHNAGQIPHDAYLGDEAAQMDHEKEMATGAMHKNGPDAITVAPGQTGELTHTFKSGQSILIGCHQPGHYAAGMKLKVDVA
jgi:uncharacterized cupredoxin-like copper-binding protein